MTLKQDNMLFLHNDNINNIHYKLRLNLCIYLLVFTHQWSQSMWLSVEKKNIMDDDTMLGLFWLVTFLIFFFGNL